MPQNSPIRRIAVTAAVWIFLIGAVFVLVQFNRAREAQYQKALASPDESVRDSMVRSLASQDILVETLTNSENPDEDSSSKQNVLSVKIRKDAVDSLNRLAASGQLTIATAMNNLFLLAKDSDGKVKDAAKAGLADIGKQSDANLTTLVAKLKSGDPDLRGAARDVLGLVGGLKTAQMVDPLVQDSVAQNDAEDSLAKIGAAAIPIMGTHLADKKADIRKKFADMLGGIGTPETINYLKPIAVSDTDASIRRVALVSLTKIVISSFDAYTKATADADAAKRAGKPAAAWSGPSESDMALVRGIEPILVQAVTDQTQENTVRAQAALTLGRIASPTAVTTLVAALSDYDPQVSHAAMQGVQATGAQAVAPLIAVLGSGSDEARRNAAEALGGIGTPQALDELKKILADHTTPQPLRRVATSALGRSGDVAVVPQLIQALGDSDGGVVNAAEDALIDARLSDAAIPQLIAAFAMPTPIPFNASQVLNNLGNKPVPALKEALAKPDVQTQLWAAVTLGQANTLDPDTTAALKALQSSPNPQVRYAASQAVAGVGGA
jgi:HEAT repeat protein